MVENSEKPSLTINQMVAKSTQRFYRMTSKWPKYWNLGLMLTTGRYILDYILILCFVRIFKTVWIILLYYTFWAMFLVITSKPGLLANIQPLSLSILINHPDFFLIFFRYEWRAISPVRLKFRMICICKLCMYLYGHICLFYCSHTVQPSALHNIPKLIII